MCLFLRPRRIFRTRAGSSPNNYYKILRGISNALTLIQYSIEDSSEYCPILYILRIVTIFLISFYLVRNVLNFVEISFVVVLLWISYVLHYIKFVILFLTPGSNQVRSYKLYSHAILLTKFLHIYIFCQLF